MAWFDNFPYSVMQKLNLDWILKKINAFQKQLDSLQVENTVQYIPQTLTVEQKAQARTNIGAQSTTDVITAIQTQGDARFVKYTAAQTLTDAQKTTARQNIGALGADYTPEDVVQYVPQTLTESEKLQARTNIGAISDVGVLSNGNNYFVQFANQQTLTDDQRAQARANIGAQSSQNVVDLIDSRAGAQFVQYSAAQALTDAQKAQARANIGADTALTADDVLLRNVIQTATPEQMAIIYNNIGVRPSQAIFLSGLSYACSLSSGYLTLTLPFYMGPFFPASLEITSSPNVTVLSRTAQYEDVATTPSSVSFNPNYMAFYVVLAYSGAATGAGVATFTSNLTISITF